MLSMIVQVEQWRSVHRWRETSSDVDRGTGSDFWPSAISTETRKKKRKIPFEYVGNSFSVRRPPLLFGLHLCY